MKLSLFLALLMASSVGLANTTCLEDGLGCDDDSNVVASRYKDTITLICRYEDRQFISVTMELSSPENTLTKEERCKLARCAVSTADYCQGK